MSIRTWWKRLIGETPARRRSGQSFDRSAQALEPRELLTVFSTETVANTTRVLNQIDVATASNGTDRSVAVWVHLASPTNADIRAQLFDNNGVKTGPEIQVADTTKSELKPAVAMDSLGNFVVTWQVLQTTRAVDVVYYGLTKQRVPTPVNPAPSDPPPRNVIDIAAQRFDSNGSPMGNRLIVANSSIDEFDPSIAMTPQGPFVISYTAQVSTTNQDIRARLFFANGSTQRDITVASASNFNECRSSVGRANDGRIVVAYESTRANTNDSNIQLARISPSGIVQAVDAVATSGSSDDERPSVSVDRFGNSVVVWEHFRSPTNRDIWSRTVSSIGQLGSVVTVTSGLYDEDLPTVAMHPSNGSYVVGFVSNNERVIVAEVSSAGVVERRANLVTGSFAPSITMFEDGQYIVAYDRLVSASRDILFRRGQFGGGGTIGSP